MRPQTWLMPVATAGVAAVAAEVLPRMAPLSMFLPATPTGKLIGQVGVAAGGAFVLPMLGFRRFAPWWFVGALVPAVVDMVQTYVLPQLGLGAYIYQPSLRAYVYDSSAAAAPVMSLPSRAAMLPAQPIAAVGARVLPKAPWRQISYGAA